MLQTTLADHAEHERFKRQNDPLLQGMRGKAFKSINTRGMDPEVRKGLVHIRMDTAKKAGTASNQAAAAATSWIAQAAAGGFQEVQSIWAGRAGLLKMVYQLMQVSILRMTT